MQIFKRGLLFVVFSLFASTGAWKVFGDADFVPVGHYITYEEASKRYAEDPAPRANEIVLQI